MMGNNWRSWASHGLMLAAGLLLGGLLFAYILDKKLEGYRARTQVSTVNYTPGQASTPRYFEPTVNFQTAATRSVQAVVFIQSQVGDELSFRSMFGGSTERSTGSGVIISADGYIITNHHVVDKADKIMVTLYGREEYAAELVASDPNTDLAVLKIQAHELPTLSFGNSDQVTVGQWVLAVGNPFNLTSTVTAGIVSAKARNIGITRSQLRSPAGADLTIEAFIQTDAAVNPGNSGGALVNLSGELVGINTAIASSSGFTEGYSFAIPSNLVQKVVNDLIEYQVVQRGFLGVSIDNISSARAQEYALDTRRGALIIGLSGGGAAQAAGLQTGDVIQAIDGHSISNTGELQEYIATQRPGSRVQVGYLRAGKKHETPLVLRNINGSTALLGPGSQPRASKNEASDLLHDEMARRVGAAFEQPSAAELEKAGLEHGIRVSEVSKGSMLAKAGVRVGTIIYRANRKPVRSPDDLLQIIAAATAHVHLEAVLPSGKQTTYLLTLE